MSDYVTKLSGEMNISTAVNRTIIFHGQDNKEIGRLYPKDGKLHFEGDADESAKVFFSSVSYLYNNF